MGKTSAVIDQRPTPADPLPGTTVDRSIPGPKRTMPPELGPDAIAVLEGRTFMYSDSVGDVPKGSIGGLVHADTRFLSRWALTINGAPFLVLRGGTVDYYSAEFFLTNPRLEGLEANNIGLRRLRFVGNGLHERLELESYRDEPVRIELRLAVDNDFADLFEIKDRVRDRSDQIVRTPAPDRTGLTFRYTNKTFTAETTHRGVGRGDPDRRRRPDLGHRPAGSRPLDLRAARPAQARPARAPADACRLRRRLRARGRRSGRGLARSAAAARVRLASARGGGRSDRARPDRAPDRREVPEGETIRLPAAGLPWFLTLFGRDTLLSAYQTVAFGPGLARGALVALAALQADKTDDFRDMEPGKILHELRMGELTKLGLKPHSPYYGSADSTPLWLILLSEYWRWTATSKLVGALRDNALAALAWIDESGDRDGDGYVEYGTRSSQGLGNQCWRDSYDGVQFADGTIPFLPIATAEIQGYVYDAKLRLAELADGPFADPALATRLRGEAAALRERFERDFWIDARGGYYAIGLDGDKRQIDSLTSNIGQLLWTGIVSEERAAIVARQLMSDALFSGWGVRTLSTDDAGFNPIGYHRGTVWPHDNSIIAHGLARYGFRDEANRIALAMLDAAAFSGYRLPEAFSGYPRALGRFPVPYPTACSPQAWATGAPLLLGRAMLGLEARDGQVTLDPALPDEIGRVAIHGLQAFGTRWDIEAIGRNSHVRLAREG